MTPWFSAITAVVASFALFLTGWQFLTRHRPFVGTESVSGPNKSAIEGSVIEISIHNWGPVAATDVHLEVLEYDGGGTPSLHKDKRSWTAPLFPDQTVVHMVFFHGPDEGDWATVVLEGHGIDITYKYNSSFPKWIPFLGSAGHTERWILSDHGWIGARGKTTPFPDRR